MEAEQRDKLYQEFDERVEKDPILHTAMMLYEAGDCKRSEALMTACVVLSKTVERLMDAAIQTEMRKPQSVFIEGARRTDGKIV
jgi:hypothetical protein